MHQMAMTLGGRAAEEIVFHEVTTGAANDLEKVTSTSKSMIMRFGMSEKLGPRVLGHSHDQPFLGRDYGAEADYSEEIAREIDDEIRRVIEEAHELALATLREHMDSCTRSRRSSSSARRSTATSSSGCSPARTSRRVFPARGRAAELPSRSRRKSRSASASRARARSRSPARRCSRRRIPQELTRFPCAVPPRARETRAGASARLRCRRCTGTAVRGAIASASGHVRRSRLG